MSQGKSNSGVVIFGDMILKWKRIWSHVAAGLRSAFRQKAPTSAQTIHRYGLMNSQNPGDNPLAHQ